MKTVQTNVTQNKALALNKIDKVSASNEAHNVEKYLLHNVQGGDQAEELPVESGDA